MKTRIKICGITRSEDALKSQKSGVWALGFIFSKESKRFISPSKAKLIISDLDNDLPVKKIGVFINEDIEIVRNIYKDLGLDYIQLHGDEDAAYCRSLDLPYIKVFHSGSNIDFKDFSSAFGFLIDAGNKSERGGTGKLSNWSQAANIALTQRLFLAGGLGPHNIISALKKTNCFGYDLNSSLEITAGIKDHNKIDELKIEMDEYEK